ncbi:MAG: DUF6268 family outer membrane beta-barrel protein [bacterium]
MKILSRKAIGLIAGLAVLVAVSYAEEPSDDAAAELKRPMLSHEFSTDYSYAGKATLHQGDANLGKLDSQSSSARYILSYDLTDGLILRFGADWQRFSFGIPSGAPVPNTLQSVAAVIGADIELSDNWLMRVEVEPGLYSDFHDISFDDVNMPSTIGFSYIVDKDLQWFFGVMVNPRSSIPVLPGAGVRWKFADQWTLMLLFPKPRLEYEVIEGLTLYVGGEIKGGNYQVGENFGSKMGRTDLDNDNVAYREIHAGGGVAWRFLPFMKLELEGGWVFDRRLEYPQSDLILTSGGAPYGQVALSAAF